MNIQKFTQTYKDSLQHFYADDVLNFYDGVCHNMFIREENFANMYCSSSYRKVCEELEIPYSKAYPFDNFACYEKELDGI